MVDEFSFKFELLKREMDAVQNGIRTYGQVQFTIKGWAITLFSGFVIFAADKHEPKFYILCAIAVTLFWALDTMFKGFQLVYISRALEIERWSQRANLSSGQDPFQGFPVPNIETVFERLKQRTRRQNLADFIRTACTPQLMLLYLVMLVVAVLLASIKI